nr:MAG: putative replicase [Planococcus ficus-associated reovirus 1]
MTQSTQYNLKATLEHIKLMETIVQTYSLDQTYTEIVIKWINDLDLLSCISSDRALLTLENQYVFDNSILVSFTNHNFCLSMFKGFIVDNEWCDVDFINDLTKIRKPPIYVFGKSFEVDWITNNVTKSSFKYMTNFNAFDALKECEKVLTKVKVEDYDFRNGRNGSGGIIIIDGRKFTHSMLYEYVLISHFIRKYSTSRRLLNAPKLIQIIFETSNFSDDRGFKWYSNPILITLSILYSDYSEFPFIEGDGETEYLQSCSFILPHLTYMLCELWYKYMLMEITQEELIVIIKSYVQKSTSSFDEWMLEFKEYRIGSLKFLTEMLSKTKSIQYGVFGPSHLAEVIEPTEVWDMGEREDLINNFIAKAPSPLLRYLIKRKVIKEDLSGVGGRIFNDIAEVRAIYGMINLCGQNGLFVKNPVILTLDKSLKARAGITTAPSIKSYIKEEGSVELPLVYEYNWHDNDLLGHIFEKGRELMDKYIPQLNRIKLEQEYVRALTNNSSGTAYEPTEEEKKLIDQNYVQTLGKKRLPNYLLRPEVYDVENLWREAILERTSSGERKQVDRRPRVIQMVSNTAQMAPLVLYVYLDMLSNVEPELSTKKNSGTIRDMLMLLRATSNIHTVCYCGDISAMDGSTNKYHTQLMNELMRYGLDKCNHARYFFATRKDCVLIEKDDYSERHTRKTINPASYVIALTERFAELKNFTMKIVELSFKGIDVTIETSDDVFPSGRYSTSPQHSILNKLSLTVIRDKMAGELQVAKKLTQFITANKASGDDIISTLYLPRRNDDVCRLYNDLIKRVYNGIGFDLTKGMSRYNATYLQQTAAFGITFPKADRISITTSEHGESLKIGLYEGFNEVKDIVYELCGRVAFSESAKPILVLMANQMRRIRCKVLPADDLQVIARKLKDMYDSEYNSARLSFPSQNISRKPLAMLISKEYIHTVLPVISIFLQDGFDLPIVATNFNGTVRDGDNIFSPGGFIRDWRMREILKKFRDDECELLFRGMLDEEYVKINKTYMTSDAYTRAKELSKLVPAITERLLHARYDQNLAILLGLPWMKAMNSFNYKDWIKRHRISRVDTSFRIELSQRLEQRLDPGKVLASRLAHMKLLKMGYNVPDELGYYHSPIERINQAITSGDGSSQAHLERYIPF